MDNNDRLMKYIDADILRDRIKKNKYVIEPMFLKGDDSYYEGEDDGYNRILSIIDSLQQEQPTKVYRVENEKEQKGLWRKFDGTWEPLFDMLTDGQCKDLPMEDNPIYREGGKQWFASAPSKKTLQKWFSKRDLEELTAKGFTISEFEVVGHKKISDFEYIFTRDNIISRTYLKVSDIYSQEQQEVDLEKEWNEFEDWMETYNQADYPTSYTTRDIARHFAKWGAEHTPLPEDTVIFNKGIEEGKRLMMEEAVEGFIFQSEDYYPKELIARYDGELKHGDKVSIIILPKEEK